MNDARAPTGAGALDHVAADRAAAVRRVRERLADAGATDAMIEAALADDVADLLAVDLLILPSGTRYTPRQVSEEAGLALDVLKQLWRALGFLEAPDDEPWLGEMDVAAARDVRRLLELGVVGLDTAFQLARVIGSSMARIAEAELARATRVLGAAEDSVAAADAFTSVADETLAVTGDLLEFVWRRHTQAVARRAIGVRVASRDTGSGPVLCVGFADMVGFTLMSQHLQEDELERVVRRFEEISYDTVTAHGGRVVKTIGDEVMFVVRGPLAAARIGLELSEAYADDELLGEVRVGIAAGPVLVRDGDYFGPTVNLAARIVGIAEPGTVLVSDGLHALLEEARGGGVTGSPLRPRVLKDVGRVQLWTCRRRPGKDGEEAAGAGHPPSAKGGRFDRLAAVLRDLEELRAVGERAVAGVTGAAERAGRVAEPGEGVDRDGGGGDGGGASRPDRRAAADG
jgi:adenylate cyclase